MKKSGASRESGNLLPETGSQLRARNSPATTTVQTTTTRTTTMMTTTKTTRTRMTIKLQPLDPGQPAANADNKTTTTQIRQDEDNRKSSPTKCNLWTPTTHSSDFYKPAAKAKISSGPRA